MLYICAYYRIRFGCVEHVRAHFRRAWRLVRFLSCLIARCLTSCFQAIGWRVHQIRIFDEMMHLALYKP